MVGTLSLPGVRVLSIVRELRFHKPHCMTKNNNNKNVYRCDKICTGLNTHTNAKQLSE